MSRLLINQTNSKRIIRYCIVASTSPSRFEAHAGLFRLSMGDFQCLCTMTFWQKVDFPNYKHTVILSTWWHILTCFMILGGVGKQEMVLNQAQMYKVNVNETCYTMKPTSTLKFQYGYLYTLVPAVFLTIYVSNFLTYHFLSCQASFGKPPNVSTTPITAMGCRQCLSLSVVQLKGKLCQQPHCRNGVVDTFRYHLW